jgi:hypothetical protein
VKTALFKGTLVFRFQLRISLFSTNFKPHPVGAEGAEILFAYAPGKFTL